MGDLAEHENGVVTAVSPSDGVEAAEHASKVGFPNPEQVVGEFGEAGQLGRQGRLNEEFLVWADLERHGYKLLNGGISKIADGLDGDSEAEGGAGEFFA